VHSAEVSGVLGGAGVEVRVDGRGLHAEPLGQTLEGRRRVRVDDEVLTVWDNGDVRVVESGGRGYRLRVPQSLSVERARRERGSSATEGDLTAPMPARVVKIAVERGDQVSPNQPLIVLEAMKMEHVVEAPHAGVVAELCVALGQQVASGERLLTLE
jgi:biotin carboxyl carrier protein